MYLHISDPLDTVLKGCFIAGAVIWALVCLWQNRGELRTIPKAIRNADAPTIGVMVCMALFWFVFVGSYFWGASRAGMTALFALMAIMTVMVQLRRNA